MDARGGRFMEGEIAALPDSETNLPPGQPIRGGLVPASTPRVAVRQTRLSGLFDSL